jgi:hypothetical protein
MVNRRFIYESFIRYARNSIVHLTNVKLYYDNRLEIANNKLDIFKLSLEQHKRVFKLVYNIELKELDNEKITLSYYRDALDTEIKVNEASSRIRGLYPEYDTHTVIFVKTLIESYIEIRNEIKTIKRQLQLNDSKLSFFTKYSGISKNIFYYIISKCNSYYEQRILDGKSVDLGYNIGFIRIAPKNVKGKINWAASFDFRNKLIANGKIPFKEEDSLKAKASGIVYNGVRWFVYYDNEVQHYINWYHYSTKLPNRNAFTFMPSRFNKEDLKYSEMKETITDVKELSNLRIGIVNKLDISLAINDRQFLKYADNGI